MAYKTKSEKKAFRAGCIVGYRKSKSTKKKKGKK